MVPRPRAGNLRRIGTLLEAAGGGVFLLSPRLHRRLKQDSVRPANPRQLTLPSVKSSRARNSDNSSRVQRVKRHGRVGDGAMFQGALPQSAMAEGLVSAHDALGLIYVDDRSPGIRRRRAGKGFAYFDADNRAIRAKPVLARIRALAIPPAYDDVWICAAPNGHLQATGRDARGRKQYRYHAQYRELAEASQVRTYAGLRRSLAAPSRARRSGHGAKRTATRENSGDDRQPA